MKKLILANFLTLFISPLWSITITIDDPCLDQELYRFSMKEVDLNQSVGEAMIHALNKFTIPYIGSMGGLNSLLHTPTGLDAIEVIDDTRLRAYGWCYEVNGIQPDVMMDKYFFDSPEDSLRWFYGYSFYDRGEWKEYCIPAYQSPLKRYCN